MAQVSHPPILAYLFRAMTNDTPACRDASKDAFATGMYQWASTLTSSGQNMPFALPIQADKLPAGFTLSFLRVISGRISTVSMIECAVEDVGEVSICSTSFHTYLIAVPGEFQQYAIEAHSHCVRLLFRTQFSLQGLKQVMTRSLMDGFRLVTARHASRRCSRQQWMCQSS